MNESMAPESIGAISMRQRQEWERFRQDIILPLFARVMGGDEKNAKTLADILKIAQDGERKAWGFAECQQTTDNQLTVCFED